MTVVPVDRRAAELPAVRLGSATLNERIVRIVPLAEALDLRLIPIRREARDLVVAVAEPLTPEQLRRVSLIAGTPIRQVRATLDEIRATLARIWGVPWTTPAPVVLGEWLVQLGALTDEALRVIDLRRTDTERSLDRVLLTTGEADPVLRGDAVGLWTDLPSVDLDRWPLPPGLAALIDQRHLAGLRVVPVSCDGFVLTVAIADPTRRDVLDQIARTTGYQVRPAICRADQILAALGRALSAETGRERNGGLGDLLVGSGRVRRDDFAFAAEVAGRTGEPIADVLVRLGTIDANAARRVIADRHGLALLDQPPAQAPEEGLRFLPRALAERHRAVIVGVTPERIDLAVADPADHSLEEWIGYVAGRPIRAVVADPAVIDRLLRDLATLAPPAWPVAERLSDFLLRHRWIDDRQLAVALALQRGTDLSFGRALIDSRALTEEDLLIAQSLWIGLPKVHLDRVRIADDLLTGLSSADLLSLRMLPLRRAGRSVYVAVHDPFDGRGIERIERAIGLVARPVLASESDLVAAIERNSALPIVEDGNLYRRVGETLIGRHLVSASEWRTAILLVADGEPLDLALRRVSGRDPGLIAAELGRIFRLEVVDVVPVQLVESVVDALGISDERRTWRDPVEPNVAQRLSLATATATGCLPIRREGESIVVACANPADRAGLDRVAGEVGGLLRWVIASRPDIEAAIQRTIGRKNLGTYLLEAGVITQDELNRALEYARTTGTRLGQALITLEIIRPDQLAEFLAVQHGIVSVDLTWLPIDPAVVRLIPESLARERALVPIAADDERMTVGLVDPLDDLAIEQIEHITGRRVDQVLTTERAVAAVLQDTYRLEYLRQSALDLVTRRPDESALRVLSTGQAIFLFLLVVLVAAGLAWDAILTLIVLNAAATLFYFAFSGYRFYLISKAFGHSLEIAVSDEELQALSDRDLPVYTILVPLYREAAVVGRLTQAIDRIDYPKAKLDVKFLVEEDDPETLEAILARDLAAHFRVVVVPHGLPKGKPKACNYGLIQAQGQYVVIYDAEDIPDPDQLKKAVIAFRRASPDVACIQSKLNYFNRRQNLLTRWFTTEYSMWFDLFLPGLDAVRAPIPLGGTSNHFPTEVLKAIGAWDPWNVTEDADIGIRLFKAGYRTAIVDSTTYEEANSEIYNWIRQRSRWVKGYIQTYLVHMRHPWRLLRELGPAGFLSFQLVIGGTIFAFLVNPIYWLITVLWFLTHAGIIEQIFPAPIFYLGAFALYVGNFAFAYVNVAGCVQRRYYDMVKYAVLSPIYWALMSIGAWKGFLQLLYKPSYWEKTVHGLYAGPIETQPARQVRDLF